MTQRSGSLCEILKRLESVDKKLATILNGQRTERTEHKEQKEIAEKTRVKVCELAVGALAHTMALDMIEDELRKIRALLTTTISEPGNLTLTDITEGEKGMLEFSITLPAVNPADKVVQRNLSVAGVDQPPITDVSLTTAPGRFQAEAGPLELALSDQDKAGNVSTTHRQTVELAAPPDVTPPGEPGDFGVADVVELP